MGRSKRSKNKQKNMRHAKKNSFEYQEKAKLKLRNKVNRKMEKRHLIGIYDSYRLNGKFNYRLNDTNSKFIGSYSTQPIYSMFDLGINDVMIIKNGQHSIKIEVWEVSDKMLASIERDYGYYDELTQEGNIYLKEEIISPFGKILLFTYNDIYDESKMIISGDWIEYLNEQRVKSSTVNLVKNNPMRDAFDKIMNHSGFAVDKEFMD